MAAALMLLVVMLTTNPNEHIFYALIAFTLLGALIYFGLGLFFGLFYFRAPGVAGRRRFLLLSVTLTVIIMVRSTGQLSMSDALLIILLSLGCLFYIEKRFRG